MNDDSNWPVWSGLAIGIAFIIVFTLVIGFDSTGFVKEKPRHVTVIIPKGSSLPTSEHNNFEPAAIKVVVGVNNTVRWVNQDITSSSIRADNMSDPEFYKATHLDDEDDSVKLLLEPGDTFEFTFTMAGKFGYHSEPHPHKHGTIIVLDTGK